MLKKWGKGHSRQRQAAKPPPILNSWISKRVGLGKDFTNSLLLEQDEAGGGQKKMRLDA